MARSISSPFLFSRVILQLFLLLGRIAMHSIRCGLLLHIVAWSVCVSVGHGRNTAKTDEPIEIPFVAWTLDAYETMY